MNKLWKAEHLAEGIRVLVVAGAALALFGLINIKSPSHKEPYCPSVPLVPGSILFDGEGTYFGTVKKGGYLLSFISRSGIEVNTSARIDGIETWKARGFSDFDANDLTDKYKKYDIETTKNTYYLTTYDGKASSCADPSRPNELLVKPSLET